jgi:dTMP kinase
LSAPAGGPEFRPLDAATMALAFAADRTDHLNTHILPRLKDGVHVIADRYYLSSLAYQSMDQDLDWLRQVNRNATTPDLTVFLDVPPAVCVERMRAHRWHVELYEDPGTLERVYAQYRTVIGEQRASGERIDEVDGNQPVADVHAAVVRAVTGLVRDVVARNGQPLSRDHDQPRSGEPLTSEEIAARSDG